MRSSIATCRQVPQTFLFVRRLDIFASFFKVLSLKMTAYRVSFMRAVQVFICFKFGSYECSKWKTVCFWLFDMVSDKIVRTFLLGHVLTLLLNVPDLNWLFCHYSFSTYFVTALRNFFLGHVLGCWLKKRRVQEVFGKGWSSRCSDQRFKYIKIFSLTCLMFLFRG